MMIIIPFPVFRAPQKRVVKPDKNIAGIRTARILRAV